MPKIFGSGQSIEDVAFSPEVMATNGPQAPRLQSPANLAVETPKQDFLASIETQLKDAMDLSATDSLAAARNLANVKGAIAAEDARFFKEARGQAYTEFQIPYLTQVLEQNIQMDRSTPAYVQKYGMADSDETAAVRRQLHTAKAAADASINEKLLGNPYYRTLKAKATTLESLIENQYRKAAERDANIDAKAAEFYYSIPPEQKSLFDKAIGNVNGDSRMALAAVGRMPAAEKVQLETLMQAGSQGLASLALSGNIFAKRVLHQDETQVFGDKEQTAKRLTDIENIAKDPKLALTAFKELKAAGIYGSGKEAEAKMAAISAVLQTASSGNKEQQQLAAQRKIEIAKDYAAYKTNKEFNSDIVALRTKSLVPLPAWLDVASQRPEVGKIDKNKAIQLANDATSTEEKRKRVNELVEFYNSASTTQNKSHLFTVNPLAAEQLRTEATLLGVFGKALSKIGSALPSFAIPNMTDEQLSNYMREQSNR